MWQTPKTDWKSSDWINIEDFNRIRGNLLVLQEMTEEAYKEVLFDDMGEDMTYNDYPYADRINAIEKNVAAICKNAYPFTEEQAVTYYPNQPALRWDELNRIESLMLNRYDYLLAQLNGRKTLAFTLGGGEF